MGAVRGGTAVTANAHADVCPPDAEAGPEADSVVIRSEVPVPGVIDGEERLYGARNIHAAEYKMGLRHANHQNRAAVTLAPLGRYVHGKRC